MKSQNSEWETLIPADVIEISAFRSAGFVKLHWRSSVGRGLPMYPSSRMTGEDARFFQNPGNMGRVMNYNFTGSNGDKLALLIFTPFMLNFPMGL